MLLLTLPNSKMGDVYVFLQHFELHKSLRINLINKNNKKRQDEKCTLNLLKITLQAINNALTMFFDEEKSRKNDPLELCELRLK